MPTLPQAEYPRPTASKEFEQICFSLYRKEWEDPHAQPNGRTGQPQAGVDIYGNDRNNGGALTGVQCKLHAEGHYLALREVKAEVQKAEAFQPALAVFVVATTSPSDSRLQAAVRKLSADREQAGKFAVYVHFWEHFQSRFVVYPEILRQHYPQFFPGSASGTTPSQESIETRTHPADLLARYRAHLASLQTPQHHPAVREAANRLSSGTHLSASAGRLSPLGRAFLSDFAGRLPSLDQVFVAQVLRDDRTPSLDSRYEWKNDLPWTETIWAAIEAHPILVIEAGPGTGKSVLLQRLAREAAQQSTRKLVPVVVPAASLLVEHDLSEALCRHVQSTMAAGDRNLIAPELFRSAPADGSIWLILVDDIDVLAWEETDRRPELLQRLRLQATSCTPPMRFILTSRGVPDQLIVREHVGRATLDSFQSAQVSVFAHQWFKDMPSPDPTDTSASRFLGWIHQHGVTDLLRDVPTHPLVLTFAALICEAHWHNMNVLANRAWVYTELATLALGGEEGYAYDREQLRNVWQRLNLGPVPFRWDAAATSRERILETAAKHANGSRTTVAVAQHVLEADGVLPSDANDGLKRKFVAALLHSTRLLSDKRGRITFMSSEVAAFFTARAMARDAQRQAPRSAGPLRRLFRDREQLTLPFPNHVLAMAHGDLWSAHASEVVFALGLAQNLDVPVDVDDLVRRELGRDRDDRNRARAHEDRVRIHARGVVLAGEILAAGVRLSPPLEDDVWEDLVALATTPTPHPGQPASEAEQALYQLSRFGPAALVPHRVRALVTGGAIDEAMSVDLIQAMMGVGARKQLSLLILHATVDRIISVPDATVNAAVWALVRLGCGERAAGLVVTRPAFSARVFLAHICQLVLAGRSREAAEKLITSMELGFGWDPDADTQREAAELLLTVGRSPHLAGFLVSAADREIPVNPKQWQRIAERILSEGDVDELQALLKLTDCEDLRHVQARVELQLREILRD